MSIECPCCRGPVTVHEALGEWVADVWHKPDCPTRWAMTATLDAEMDLAGQLAAVLHLAEYAVHGALLVTRHQELVQL
jgi:hypothetical protein